MQIPYDTPCIQKLNFKISISQTKQAAYRVLRRYTIKQTRVSGTLAIRSSSSKNQPQLESLDVVLIATGSRLQRSNL